MALATYPPTVWQNGTAPAQNATNLNKPEVALKNVTDEVILNTQRLDDLETPATLVLVPQVTDPTYTDGQIFYNDNTGTLDVQGKYPDVTLKVSRQQHLEVTNNTLAIIEKGKIVTQAGVINGIPEVKLALADTFNNARIIGVTAHAIGVGETGILITFGEVVGLSSVGVTTGIPLYLSSIVPGEFVEIAPDIRSRVGGMMVADASVGKMFVLIINNKNLPTVFGKLQGQTAGNDTYSVTSTAQDIINYDTIKELVITVAPLTGEITVANDGEYRMHFTASVSFLSTISTRSITIQVYSVTNSAILFSHVLNIPRDATEDGLSFNFLTEAVADDVYRMRIKSSVAIDITFMNICFDMVSVDIK